MNTFILILNYNAGKETLNCLKLFNELDYLNNIIVIDNGSQDNSVNIISNHYPKIKIIENKQNLGFAKGMNVGIKYALENNAKRILLLNNDTEFSKKAFEILLNTNEDITGPVLRYIDNGKTIFDLGGYINYWTGRAYHKETTKIPKNLFSNPDYVSGAVMLVNKEVFKKVGLLDERFFLYYEDADFCIRARNKGFKIKLEQNSVFYHELGLTSGRLSKISLINNLRSNLLFINKNILWYRKPIAWTYWFLLVCKVSLNQVLATIRI